MNGALPWLSQPQTEGDVDTTIRLHRVGVRRHVVERQKSSVEIFHAACRKRGPLLIYSGPLFKIAVMMSPGKEPSVIWPLLTRLQSRLPNSAPW